MTFWLPSLIYTLHKHSRWSCAEIHFGSCKVTQKLFPLCTMQNLNSAQLTFQITANTQHYLYRKIKVACKTKAVIFIFLSGTPEVNTTPVPTHATSSLGLHELHWVNKLTHVAYFSIFPRVIIFNPHQFLVTCTSEQLGGGSNMRMPL